MGESNTVVSAYTLYSHLQHYCSHPSILCELCYLEEEVNVHLSAKEIESSQPGQTDLIV